MVCNLWSGKCILFHPYPKRELKQFTFTWKRQQCTLTALLQGSVNSPDLGHKIIWRDLSSRASLKTSFYIICYIDNITQIGLVEQEVASTWGVLVKHLLSRRWNIKKKNFSRVLFRITEALWLLSNPISPVQFWFLPFQVLVPRALTNKLPTLYRYFRIAFLGNSICDQGKSFDWQKKKKKIKSKLEL